MSKKCPEKLCHYVQINPTLRQYHFRTPVKAKKIQDQTPFEIDILFPAPLETIYELTPTMRFSEYFSMVGGIIGLYFGLSLINLVKICKKFLMLIHREIQIKNDLDSNRTPIQAQIVPIQMLFTSLPKRPRDTYYAR